VACLGLGLASLDARGQGFPVKVLADKHHLDDYLLSVGPASLTGPKLDLLVHAVEDKLLVAEGSGLQVQFWGYGDCVSRSLRKTDFAICGLDFKIELHTYL
jgi:hypothetical protein